MILCIILLALLFISPVVSAQDWTQWRGPDSNGITKESLVPDKNFAFKDPVWTQQVGEGCGSVVVFKDALFATGWQGGEESVSCIDTRNGVLIWKHSYKAPAYGRFAFGDQQFYKGPTASPVLDPGSGLLITLGSDGDLNCWDTRQHGKLKWNINLYENYKAGRRPDSGGGQRDFGYTTAPLILGKELLLAVGGKAGLLVALDLESGKQRWTSHNQDYASHCGGISPIMVEGTACVAVLSLDHLVIIRTDRGHMGETLAKFPWKTDYANNIATPAVFENKVLLTSAYNHREMVLLEVNSDGIDKKWESGHFSGVGSPIIYNNKIYFSFLQLNCLDLTDGTLLWKGGRFGPDGSCLLTADGYLVIFGNGKLVLANSAENAHGQYKEIASYRDICPSNYAWPHIVLAHSRIYCKDKLGNIYCFATRN